jgi:hypothetical protein
MFDFDSDECRNAKSKTWVVTSLYIGEHCHTKAFSAVGMCRTNEIQRYERILTREGKLAPACDRLRDVTSQ